MVPNLFKYSVHLETFIFIECGLKVGLLLEQNTQIVDLTYFTKD